MDIPEHNRRVLMALQPGDLVEFDRVVYQHWGVYVGQGMIVHLTGDGLVSGPNGGIMAEVRHENFWTVANGFRADINKTENTPSLKSQDIVQRAMNAVGNRAEFNVLSGNCEHFATWCKYDFGKSEQVDKFMEGLLIGGLVVIGVGIITVVVDALTRGDRNRRY